jgi:hypothetical protein
VAEQVKVLLEQYLHLHQEDLVVVVVGPQMEVLEQIIQDQLNKVSLAQMVVVLPNGAAAAAVVLEEPVADHLEKLVELE